MSYLNLFVVGPTRRGKTYFADRAIHQPAGCFSIAVNTKRVPSDFTGPRASTLGQVAESWRRHRTFAAASQRRWYGHPVFFPDRDLKTAQAQFEQLVNAILDEAEESGFRGDQVHVQLVVDEAHKLDGPALESVTRTGLGLGIRTVVLDQTLCGPSIKTRNNLDHWVLFGAGKPDFNVMRSQYGQLYEPVLAWTSRRYHYVEDLDNEIRCHEPWPSTTWHPPDKVGGAPPAAEAVG